jgi:hypothetical protein
MFIRSGYPHDINSKIASSKNENAVASETNKTLFFEDATNEGKKRRIRIYQTEALTSINHGIGVISEISGRVIKPRHKPLAVRTSPNNKGFSPPPAFLRRKKPDAV